MKEREVRQVIEKRRAHVENACGTQQGGQAD